MNLTNSYRLTPDGRIEKRRSRNKFNNQPVTLDGHTFPSGLEAGHYTQLKLREQAGEITGLELQPEFTLQEGFRDNQGKWQRAIKYRADFAYTEVESGRRIVVETKGYWTEAAKIKKKMFLLKYPELILRIQK